MVSFTFSQTRSRLPAPSLGVNRWWGRPSPSLEITWWWAWHIPALRVTWRWAWPVPPLWVPNDGLGHLLLLELLPMSLVAFSTKSYLMVSMAISSSSRSTLWWAWLGEYGNLLFLWELPDGELGHLFHQESPDGEHRYFLSSKNYLMVSLPIWAISNSDSYLIVSLATSSSMMYSNSSLASSSSSCSAFLKNNLFLGTAALIRPWLPICTLSDPFRARSYTF